MVAMSVCEDNASDGFVGDISEFTIYFFGVVCKLTSVDKYDTIIADDHRYV